LAKRTGVRRRKIGLTQEAANKREARPRTSRGRAEDQSGELVVQAKGGDKTAIERLWALHEPDLHVHLSRYLKDPRDVADAAQEVFILMLKALPTYELRDTPFRFWLQRIARNHAIDLLRRNRLTRLEPDDHLEQLLEAAREGSAGSGWLDDQRTAVAVASLPLEQQRMLLLRFAFGFKSEEVAVMLDCSPDAVRKQQSRALRRLKGVLETSEG
jgi:RNA polymerase sigma-70 factor, ECF subfamily